MTETKKCKTLFDHLQQITTIQNPNYWDELTDDDKRTWSNYMINRFLSMNYDYIELIAEMQPITQTLDPKLFYKVLIDVIPKGKVYLRYIKGAYEEKLDTEIVELIMADYSCSKNTAIDYYNVLINIKDGKDYIEYLRQKYGKVIDGKSSKKKSTKK